MKYNTFDLYMALLSIIIIALTVWLYLRDMSDNIPGTILCAMTISICVYYLYIIMRK